MSTTKRKRIGAAMAVVGALLYGLSMAILPETIAMKIHFDGTLKTFVTKSVGLLIPLGVMLLGSYMWIREKDRKAMILWFVSVFMSGMLMWMNWK